MSQKKKKSKVFKIIKIVILTVLFIALIAGVAFGGFFLFKTLSGGINTALSGCNGCNPAEEDQFEMGMFPQTIKADDVTISATPDADGYYTGSDGEKYAKVVASPYAGGYSFSDDTAVVNGEEYFFKLEPIVWTVIRAEDDGTALVVSNLALDAHAFCDCNNTADDCNDYKNSAVREWLNDEFLDYFTSEEMAKIITEEVDNTKGSTADWNNKGLDNPYVCDNTNDKVFLLSYVEAFESHNRYDFDLQDRGRNASDYAVAKGVELGDLNSTAYWLRSPEKTNDESVSAVGNYTVGGNGLQTALPSTQNVHKILGVVPAMWINMD